jgi:G protein-coupled receptor GPR1
MNSFCMYGKLANEYFCVGKMQQFSEPHWISAESQRSQTLHDVARGFGMRPASPPRVFSTVQNHAILAVGVTCASLSLIAALVAFQWFAFMRRSFRHHLIFLLIVGDMWKALWYFIFPVVVFTRGEVDSTSHFCQASGFFLALGTEASDYAILMIALHAACCVFRPPKVLGEGGLYPYRLWIYAFWIVLPVLAASLAFTNSKGYVTGGTYCALPKRPFWYRLGLSYIPRYLIFITIFALYAAISVYVHIKFKGFSHFSEQDSSSGTHSSSTFGAKTQLGSFAWTNQNVDSRKQSLLAGTQGWELSNRDPSQGERPEWEDVSFLTAAPLTGFSNREARGIATADFAHAPSSSSSSTHAQTQNLSTRSLQAHLDSTDPSAAQRKESEVPTLGTNFTGETRISNATAQTVGTTGIATTAQLQDTRNAIQRQIQLLFVYPVVYLLMWIFPFVNHCLQYSDYFAGHPPFWLTVAATCSLALQAGADCAVFSWREKPWRRVRRNGGREKVAKEGLRRLSAWTLGNDAKIKKDVGAGGGMGGAEIPLGFDGSDGEKGGRKRDSHWWEEEGTKRKDSVWMGTDAVQQMISRQEQDDRKEEAAPL